ncbi:MAG: phosphate ABC transporter permease subunit PstC [Thermoplasmata archaeon]
MERRSPRVAEEGSSALGPASASVASRDRRGQRIQFPKSLRRHLPDISVVALLLLLDYAALAVQDSKLRAIPFLTGWFARFPTLRGIDPATYLFGLFLALTLIQVVRLVIGDVRWFRSNFDPRDRRIIVLRWLGRGFHGVTAAIAVGILVLFVALVYVLTQGAWQSIEHFGAAFLYRGVWDGTHGIYGAGPPIVGTLLTSALALVIAVPLALGVAIFLSEIAPPWLRQPLVYVVDLSAAVPSVVYGFWAFLILVPLMRSTIEPGLASLTGGRFPFATQSLGYDVFTATIVLAVMIIPTIAAVSRESLRAVPRVYRESALSLGATRWEATRMAVIKPARSGIIAGIILGLGRALGETIAVAMVIGNIFILPGTLFSPSTTIASWIVVNFSEIGPGLEMSALLELALILLAITILVNVIARVLLRRLNAGPPSNGNGNGNGSAPRRWRDRIHLPGRARYSPGAASGPADSGWRNHLVAGMPQRLRRRRAFNWIMVALCVVCVLIAVVPLASVIWTAVGKGGSAVIQPSFYTSEYPQGCTPRANVTCSLGGIGPAIQGTFLMLGLGALIAIPVGLLAGIYLSEYGRNRFARAVSFLADVMTGLPTILIGVFVFVLFLYFDHNSALSALSGGVALSVIMIPIVTRASEEALRSVPVGVREAARALGFPRHRVSLRIVLGSARGALITGILLATSRAAGDTAAIFLTAGNSNYWFQGWSQQTAAITPFIFSNFGSPYTNLQTDAWGAALVLLLIMLGISLVARLLVRPHADASEGA